MSAVKKAVKRKRAARPKQPPNTVKVEWTFLMTSEFYRRWERMRDCGYSMPRLLELGVIDAERSLEPRHDYDDEDEVTP